MNKSLLMMGILMLTSVSYAFPPVINPGTRETQSQKLLRDYIVAPDIRTGDFLVSNPEVNTSFTIDKQLSALYVAFNKDLFNNSLPQGVPVAWLPNLSNNKVVTVLEREVPLTNSKGTKGALANPAMDYMIVLSAFEAVRAPQISSAQYVLGGMVHISYLEAVRTRSTGLSQTVYENQEVLRVTNLLKKMQQDKTTSAAPTPEPNLP